MHAMVLADVSSSLDLLGWIVIGGLAGAFAGKVMRGAGFGILGDIVVGIVGALVGEFLLGFLISGTVGIVGTFVVAFIGACFLLAILYAISGRRRRFFR